MINHWISHLFLSIGTICLVNRVRERERERERDCHKAPPCNHLLRDLHDQWLAVLFINPRIISTQGGCSGNNLLYFPFLSDIAAYLVRTEKHLQPTEARLNLFIKLKTEFLWTPTLGTFYPNMYLCCSTSLSYTRSSLQYKSFWDVEIHGGTWTEWKAVEDKIRNFISWHNPESSDIWFTAGFSLDLLY